MTVVAIIDYGMGNLDSVARAVEACGGAPRRVTSPDGLAGADHLILPGVGAFAHGMAQLHDRGFVPVLHDWRLQGRPILGICLGLQLMASRGVEGGETAGLGWLPGSVLPLVPRQSDERWPHVGWNNLMDVRPHPLWAGVPDQADVYFVHGYHLQCDDDAHILARCDYAGGFVAAAAQDNVVGLQFHPEKSQRIGFRLLGNFLALPVRGASPC